MPVFPSRTLAFLVLAVSAGLAPAQMTPDQQAQLILNTARRAFNDKNYPIAIKQFREFMQKFANHKERPAAQYGLALSLLQGPEKDYQSALNELNPLAGNQAFAEHALVIYYQGLAYRGLGVRSLAQAVVRPNEASTLRNAAHQQFGEAGKRFAEAVQAFTKRAGAAKAKPEDKGLPLDLEWACRARCDEAEMLLRLGKAKEARVAVSPLQSNPQFQKSQYQKLGLYYHGFACFLQNDLPAAVHSLNLLAPFSDPVYGTHARYLIARMHHLGHEIQEALQHYQGVLTDYEKQRATAAEELRNLDRFKDEPDEKARLEALVKGAPPDHMARAMFFLGVLQYENGQFAEALAKFATFPRDFPISSLAAEAALRQGFCQVQLKMWADAQRTLQPLAAKEPRLADQCLLWLGKSYVGAADPNNKPAYEQALKVAMESFRKGADTAHQMIVADPHARKRRGECLLELADTQQQAGMHKEAVATYNQIVQEKLLSKQAEELLHGLAVACQLAGDYVHSETACTQFMAQFPKSPLLPMVQFRHAENAYFLMLAADKANKADERKRQADEMEKRYQIVVDKYPEFVHANLARYGLAVALHRKGQFDKALERLQTIPSASRTGDLAVATFLMADCMIRLVPAKTDDPAAAGKLEEQLKKAIEMLEGFITSSPAHPQVADALIKLGYCQQQLAELPAQPQTQAKYLAAARTAYEQLLQRFPKSEQQPLAVFERGKVLASAKDVNGAIADLRRFTQDPLKATSAAPLAVLSLATLLRGQGKPQEAADALFQCRMQHEKILAADPATVPVIALLQYQHGVALREAGREPEARVILDALAKAYPARPEAQDAILRSGQCFKDEGMKKIAAGQKKLAIPNLPPAEVVVARQLVDAGYNDLRQAVQYFATNAELMRQRQPQGAVRARMLYEAAWIARQLAEPELESARTKVQQDLIQKRIQELTKTLPPGSPPLTPQAIMPPPDVPLALVPVQNFEQQARNFYHALITSVPDLTISSEARFELAELLSERGDGEGAIKLLKEVLDKKPAPELKEKALVLLGAAYLTKGDAKEALQALAPVAGDAKSPLYAQALYRTGECHIYLNEPAEAVKQFSVFRDQTPLQNLPGLSDRALLRLGHAYSLQNQWDLSRQALDLLVARFPTSPWVPNARYASAWAYQKLGQYDQAVAGFQQVIDTVATELAARAQLNIGLCRMAQKRFGDAGTALLAVPYTYDYPHLNALALMEAARAFSENKQEGQALRLLERVIKDHPNTEHAEAAKKRLVELKKG